MFDMSANVKDVSFQPLCSHTYWSGRVVVDVDFYLRCRFGVKVGGRSLGYNVKERGGSAGKMLGRDRKSVV